MSLSSCVATADTVLQARKRLKNCHSALVRYPDGGPDLPELTRNLTPGLAGIIADVHFTKQAKSQNAVGVSRMRGEAPHGGIGLCREWQSLPGLPKVRGAEHVSLLAGRGFATPGEEHLRIISLDGDTPGIGQGPFLPDAQGLPGLTHVIAGKHFTRCTGIHALGL